MNEYQLRNSFYKFYSLKNLEISKLFIKLGARPKLCKDDTFPFNDFYIYKIPFDKFDRYEIIGVKENE